MKSQTKQPPTKQTNNVKDIFNGHNLSKLNGMVPDEDSYVRFMQNLRETRAGLLSIIQSKPEYTEAIKPQFDALNHLISALMPDSFQRVDYPFSTSFLKYK